MSIGEKISKMSVKTRSAWVLGIIVLFALMVGLVSGDYYYNRASDWLAEKSNNIVVLPKINNVPFNLGLDLQGGSHLVYEADVSGIAEADRQGALEASRDVIERRVNAFGVSEPLVQVNHGMDGEYRIIVELAGIKDVKEAIKSIGETPLLEFKEQGEITAQAIEGEVSEDGSLPVSLDMDSAWKNTELTGKHLKRAVMTFNPQDGTPEVSLEFDDEGAKLFEDVTERNIGKPVAIFLDSYIISSPTVNDKISGGQAVISGRFSTEEAKMLVTRLNSGALPVPISLVSQKTVEASLGARSINNSLQAGLIGLLLVSVFMILYYRLPGFLSVISLLIYSFTVLAFFKSLPLWLALILVLLMVALMFYTFNELKLFNGTMSLAFVAVGILLFFYATKSVTLTLSGIAGLILSVGMAVDANILIFARLREELREGKTLSLATDNAFKRAWPSIRDGNVSTILTCLILMFFGTSAVQGFGTTLFIGVTISMFSAIVITRIFFVVMLGKWMERHPWLLGAKPKKELEAVK